MSDILNIDGSFGVGNEYSEEEYSKGYREGLKTTPPLPDKELEADISDIIESRQLPKGAISTRDMRGDHNLSSTELGLKVSLILQRINANYIPKSHLEPLLEEEAVTVVEDCDNCGEAGYGKIWFGRGAETGDSWGDRYVPLGEATLCEDCFKEYRIGREYCGQEVWKVSSDRAEARLSHITSPNEKAIGRNALKQEIRKELL